MVLRAFRVLNFAVRSARLRWSADFMCLAFDVSASSCTDSSTSEVPQTSIDLDWTDF